jgi:hypothetical protein
MGQPWKKISNLYLKRPSKGPDFPTRGVNFFDVIHEGGADPSPSFGTRTREYMHRDQRECVILPRSSRRPKRHARGSATQPPTRRAHVRFFERAHH